MNSRKALFEYSGGWIIEEKHRRLGELRNGYCNHPCESLNLRGNWLVVGRRRSENPRKYCGSFPEQKKYEKVVLG